MDQIRIKMIKVKIVYVKKFQNELIIQHLFSSTKTEKSSLFAS